MNAMRIFTIAMIMQHAVTQMVALSVFAIPALMEMELTAQVCIFNSSLPL